MHNTTDAVIVGGGPGGAVLALLLARQGVRVLLLEAHTDFDRDFRGDTIHPSTLELLDDLGLYDKLLELPHATFFDFPTHLPDGSVSAITQPSVSARHPRIMDVPQARFIDMLVAEAQRYLTFELQLGARAERLIEEDGVVRGVGYRSADGWHEVRADLVIGADGRYSKIRQLAGMQLVGEAEPFDVLWLRLPRSHADPERAHGIYPGTHAFLAIMARGADWQVGYVFPRDAYQELRARGLAALRASIARCAPFLADRVDQLETWQQTTLLRVEVGRVQQWFGPGLLLIGDAAHVMSPVGGVGINYAIQDAIVAANVVSAPLRDGTLRTHHLECVQRRRELPTRAMQALQRNMRPRLGTGGIQMDTNPPLAARLMRLPVLNQLPARLIAFGGLWPAKVAAGSVAQERVMPNSAARAAT